MCSLKCGNCSLNIVNIVMSTTLLDSNVILGGEIAAAAAASGEARASITLIATAIIVTAAHSTSIQVR